MIHRLVCLIATMSALGLGGCTVFPDHEPPRVMGIPVTPVVEADAPAYREILRVDTPQATEPFDSSQILTKPTPREYQVFGGVRWRDTAPVIMREFLIKTLRQEGRFEGVINETSPTGSDLTLTSDLYSFHNRAYGDEPGVSIALYSQLIDNRSRKTLCEGNFQIHTPTTGDDIDNVISTFADASNELSRQVRRWLENCME